MRAIITNNDGNGMTMEVKNKIMGIGRTLILFTSFKGGGCHD